MKLKNVLILLVILLIVATPVCYFAIPRSFSSVTDAECAEITSIAAGVQEADLEDGKPIVRSYKLSAVSVGEESFDALVSLLDMLHFRPNWRNLLPWGTNVLQSSDATSASVAIVVSGQEMCTLTFLGDSVMVGKKVYHVVDTEKLEALYALIQSYGVLS